MGVQISLSHYRKNADRGCLGTGCWGEQMDLRGKKWWEAAEHCILRSSIS